MISLTWLIGMPFCSANEPAQSPLTPKSSRIAPNQSVSIDDPAPSLPLARSLPIDAEDTLRADASTTMDEAAPEQELAEDADRAANVAKSRTSRVVRRPTRDVAAASRSAPSLPDVPWYRSGIGALSIVLGVIGVAVWSIRRWMPTLSKSGCSVLNVVGRTAISPKHSVALISMGRRFVLVGLSGERITPICEVTDPEEVAELTLRLGATRPADNQQAFESLLDGEVEEYAETPVGTGQGVTGGMGAIRNAAREPLNALLMRLRSLKMK